ncbi:phage holin family protein [Candidatus Giovannonibacteria bacterium]|nr:phage holin family protein [Candidatus Giovannonibacteria bacterium]
MEILLRLVLNTLVVLAVAYILPGVVVDGYMAAFVAALAIGVINAVIKPILFVLTLPITIITLGIFTLVLNALLLLLASAIVPGFEIAGFWTAIIFGIIFSIVNMAFHRWEKSY